MRLYSIDEIVELLAEHGKTPDDVEFVMTTGGTQAGTWDELAALEKHIREVAPPPELGLDISTFGVDSDTLVIVGKQDWWLADYHHMTEDEYYSWDTPYKFHEKPHRPKDAGPLDFFASVQRFVLEAK